MNFEKCPHCSSQWQPIDHEALLREVTNDQLDMMIWHKATIRTATASYRRHIPEHIKDWAKPETETQL
jgi:hypothetical protein